MRRLVLSLVFISLASCSTTEEVRKPTHDVSSVEVTAAEADVGGPLIEEDWIAAYEKHRDFLRECALMETRPMGEMVLRLVVSRSGEVGIAAGAATSKGDFSPSTFKCMSEEASKWTFRESGARSEIIVRLTFSRVLQRESRWGIVRADGDSPVLALDGKTVKPDRPCEQIAGSGIRCGDVAFEFYRAETNLGAKEFVETAARAQKIAEASEDIEKAVRVPVVCELHDEPVTCYMFQEVGSDRRAILFGRDDGNEFSGAFCEVPKDASDCLGLVKYEVLQ